MKNRQPWKRERNWLARHPLMMKGCAHGKTGKAIRRNQKMKLKSEVAANSM